MRGSGGQTERREKPVVKRDKERLFVVTVKGRAGARETVVWKGVS